MTKTSANLLAVGVGAGVGLGFLGVGLFVSIVMAVVASILFLGLLMMKVVLAISTVLVFIGMPIAIVLSPVIAWIPRVLARAFLVCLAVPLVWSICFAASGALLNDGLFLKGSSGFFDALLEPLAAIALLWMMLLLPTRLAQMAMLGAGAVSGGFVSRAVSYAAGSQLRDVARQHLPGWAGGHAGASDQRASGTDSRLGARLRAESVLAASKAARRRCCGAQPRGGAAVRAGSAAGASAANGASNGASGGPRWAGWGGSGVPGVRARTRRRRWRRTEGGAVGGSGLQRPSWRQEDFDAEMLEASLREQHQPVSAEQARTAREALSPETQAAVGSLVADHGAAGAAAPGLSGAGGVDAAGARGDPHARGGQPGGPSAGVRRDERVDGRVRREREPTTTGQPAVADCGVAGQSSDPAADAPARAAAGQRTAGRGRAARRTSHRRRMVARRESGAGASGGEAAVRVGLHGRADRGDDRRDPGRVRVGELAEPDPRHRRGGHRGVRRRAAGRRRVRRLADRVRPVGGGALGASVAARRRALRAGLRAR